MSIGGVSNSQLGTEADNFGTGQTATAVTGTESGAISNQANSNVASNQGTGQGQSASDAQASTAQAAGANQTNQQNFNAGQSEEAAAEASNQNENTLTQESDEAKALDTMMKTAMGTYQ